MGAGLEQYLLEKSRICVQGEGVRTNTCVFVFVLLCMGVLGIGSAQGLKVS